MLECPRRSFAASRCAPSAIINAAPLIPLTPRWLGRSTTIDAYRRSRRGDRLLCAGSLSGLQEETNIFRHECCGEARVVGAGDDSLGEFVRGRRVASPWIRVVIASRREGLAPKVQQRYSNYQRHGF